MSSTRNLPASTNSLGRLSANLGFLWPDRPLLARIDSAARAGFRAVEIAYPAVFAALERLEYAGWIACEYRPRGDTDAGLSWITNL